MIIKHDIRPPALIPFCSYTPFSKYSSFPRSLNAAKDLCWQNHSVQCQPRLTANLEKSDSLFIHGSLVRYSLLVTMYLHHLFPNPRQRPRPSNSSQTSPHGSQDIVKPASITCTSFSFRTWVWCTPFSSL